jgi:hypothetical protein
MYLNKKVSDFKSLFLYSSTSALQGKKIIDSFLFKNDVAGFTYLLRHHEEESIDDDETFSRDHVDYFIEYFSLISIAVLTGYLTKNDLQVLRPEITYYLGNAPLKRYYYKNYPLILPQILLEIVLNENFTYAETTEQSDTFLRFHALNQTIDNDDVNQFLWFLDGGENDGYDIDDLTKTLKNFSNTTALLQKNEKDALSQSVRGFLDYISFIESFSTFLYGVDNPLHQSAFWYHHEYWFNKIKLKLKSILIKFTKGIQNDPKHAEEQNRNQVRLTEYQGWEPYSLEKQINQLFSNHWKVIFKSEIKKRRDNRINI